MFVDLAELELDELQALADRLPGPHAWAWGTENIFYCRACYVAFEWGSPSPDGRCEPAEASLDRGK